jgi:hypothetical protein
MSGKKDDLTTQKIDIKNFLDDPPENLDEAEKNKKGKKGRRDPDATHELKVDRDDGEAEED